MKTLVPGTGWTAIVLLCMMMLACEKKETDPAWVGTWRNEQTADFLEFGIPIPIRNTLILSKAEFEWTTAASIFNQYIDVVIVKGELHATENEFSIIPKTMAMANDDGELQWISEGDPGWEDELAKWEFGEDNSIEYSVEGDILTLSIDEETMVFKKQS